MCLLTLFFGLAGDDLLHDVGHGDGVLDLLLGGDLSGDLFLMLSTESLLVLK